MYKKYIHIIIMSVSPYLYEKYINNIIKNKCASVSSMKCKRRHLLYIQCMEQTNENSRYCNYESDILRICCEQSNIDQMPKVIKDTIIHEPVENLMKR
jgi:hypothetical protein